ncbi:MAG: hypothetical protein FJX46_15000 [Alphaproteobacteria bacterium]|nr:hypothetical protein [Alphaproteobacteria bacterium]
MILATLGGGGHASEILTLKRQDVGPEEEFLRKLIKNMELGDVYPDYDIDDIGVARYDLDGDGQYELIVGFDRAMFCEPGRYPCPIHIYRRDKNSWSWVGGMSTHRSPSFATFEILVEPHAHEGWRVLSDGEYWHCWTRGSDQKKWYVPTEDPTRKDRETGMAGYFWAVKRGEPCPDD